MTIKDFVARAALLLRRLSACAKSSSFFVVHGTLSDRRRAAIGAQIRAAAPDLAIILEEVQVRRRKNSTRARTLHVRPRA